MYFATVFWIFMQFVQILDYQRPQQIYKFSDPLKPGTLAYHGLDLWRRSTSKKFPVYLDDYQVWFSLTLSTLLGHDEDKVAIKGF